MPGISKGSDLDLQPIALELGQSEKKEMAEIEQRPVENGTQENGVQWTLGDEDKEQEDVFPQKDDDENLPPAAPSDGQGARGFSAAAQAALIEKRKRLK